MSPGENQLDVDTACFFEIVHTSWRLWQPDKTNDQEDRGQDLEGEWEAPLQGAGGRCMVAAKPDPRTDDEADSDHLLRQAYNKTSDSGMGTFGLVDRDRH